MTPTNYIRSLIPAVSVLAFAFITPAGVGTQPAQAQTVAHAFAAAWNAHDVNAFQELFEFDADWIAASGVRHKGREAIVSDLQKEHAGWARTSTIALADMIERPVTGDVSIVTFAWQIVMVDSSNTSRSMPGTTMVVARRVNNRWWILAGQVAALAGVK